MGDERWALLVDLGASGIASADVEGYLGESVVDGLVKDYLLVDADRDANVILHVIPDGQDPYPESELRLAADLAEHRGPREEARAAELLHNLAVTPFGTGNSVRMRSGGTTATRRVER